jgi:nucleoside-diphosphate-sugar epimerase
MRVLFIGGTGNISTACTHDALRQGIELFHLNRGSSKGRVPDDVQTIIGDIRNPDEVKRLIAGMNFDVVVDWIAFTPEHIRTDLELFRDRCRQFIFISSASVYHKPVRHHIITEGTPAFNPFWPYSQNKIACERILMTEYEERGFPMTIVRPSHTYQTGWFPTTIGQDFTYPDRMLNGKPIVVHGDGSSLWTITHVDDFAVGFTGLLGHPSAIGETFHITGDEAPTWNEIHRAIGAAFGVEPEIVHVPSEVIARFDKGLGEGILGDKANSVVFDNSKIKRFVPRFGQKITFHEGMRRGAELVAEHPELKKVDEGTNKLVDTLIAAMNAVRP